jgi:hypothetical protein
VIELIYILIINLNLAYIYYKFNNLILKNKHKNILIKNNDIQFNEKLLDYFFEQTLDGVFFYDVRRTSRMER